MAKLEIVNVEKTYQTSEGKILKGISLTIEDGNMAFLLGPSGCGKSTLLRILAGLLEADSGRILLNGKDISTLPPEKRNMPMVFQNYALWPHMNVYENIAFALKNLKLSQKEIYARVREMLAAVRMEDFMHRRIPSLSGGQQQRIALARALAMNPAVLLLDEPLSNLDAKLRDTMRFEIRRICKERNLTAVYVTHDRKEALSMADQISVLEDGKISQTGSPRDIYLHPKNRFTASFLGDVNFIDAQVARINAENAVLKTPLGEWTAPLPSFELKENMVCVLAFRPEAIVCDAMEHEENAFTGRIEKSAFLGESSFRTISVSGQTINVNEYSGPERADGSEVRFAVPPGKVCILEK